jgi:hypothetical protein
MKLCYDETILQKKPQHFMGILNGIYLTNFFLNHNERITKMAIIKQWEFHKMKIINIIKTKMAFVSLHKTQSYC